MSDPRQLLVSLGADIERYIRDIERADRATAKGMANIDGAVKRAEKIFAGLGSELASTALNVVSFAAVVGGATTALTKLVSEAAEGELVARRFAAQLNATEFASGKTARQLKGLADQIKSTTLATGGDAEAAISQLLSFRTVAGEVFDNTLRLAQDLSASGFGSLTDNAAKLGKALEDPTTGFKALRSAGVILTDTQEELVKVLEKSGDRLAAQKVILDAVRERVGGAGAAERNTLTGAWHGLIEATDDWFEGLAENSGLVSRFTALLNGMADATSRAAAGFSDKELQLQKSKESDAFWFGSGVKIGYDPNKGVTLSRTQREVADTAAQKALRDQIELEQAVQRATEARARMSSAVAQQRMADERAIGEVAERLSRKRTQYAEAEKESRAVVSAFNRKADAQDQQHATVLLEERAREERVFADDMAELRADLTERLQGQDLEILDETHELAMEAVERAAADHAAIWDEAQRDMFDAYRDGWRELLSGNVRSFEDFAKTIGRIGLDLAANLIAEKTFNSVVGGVIGSAGGGAAGGAGGGWLAGLLGGGAGAATTAGMTGGGAAIGAGVYPAFATGGASTGGGLAALASNPYTIAAAAAIGAAIILPKVFGPRPSDRSEGTVFDFTNGVRREGNLGAGKASPENRASANEIEMGAASLRNLLVAAGMNVGVHGGYVEVGAGNSLAPFQASINGGAVQGFSSQAEVQRFFAEQIVDSLTDIPERFQAVVDRFDPGNIEGFIAELNRIKAADATLEGIRDEILQITDPKAWNIAQLDKTFEAIRAEFTALGIDLTDLEKLYGLKLGAINDQFAETAEVVSEVADAAVDFASAVDDALSRVASGARALLDVQREGLDAQRSTIEENLGLARSVLDSVGAARRRLTSDPQLANLSNQEAAANTMADLEAAFAAYQGGDKEAGARIAELAIAAQEANRAFNGSKADNRKIIDILNKTESFARNEITIQEMNLKANQDALALLQQQLDALQGLGKPAAGASRGVADLDALIAGFTQAGGTGAIKPGSAVFKAFEDELFAIIGGLGAEAIARMQSEHAYALSEFADPEQGGAARRRADAYAAQLRALGVPGYATGGITPGAGLARIHADELIYTGPPARVFSAAQTAGMIGGGADVKGAVYALIDVVAEGQADQVRALKDMSNRLSAIEGNSSLARMRR